MKSILRFLSRIFYGGSFAVYHQDHDGSVKVFWCDSWQEATEWAGCALLDSLVTITSPCGYLLARRFPVK